MVTLQEMLKKSVKLVVENNVSADILYVDQPVTSIGEKLQLLNSGQITKDNFLIVFCTRDDKPFAVITYRELLDFLNNLNSIQNWSENFEALSLGSKYPIKYSVIIEDDTIEKAFSFFTGNPSVDVIIALNKLGKYVGKIRRNDLKEKLKILTS